MYSLSIAQVILVGVHSPYQVKGGTFKNYKTKVGYIRINLGSTLENKTQKSSTVLKYLKFQLIIQILFLCKRRM